MELTYNWKLENADFRGGAGSVFSCFAGGGGSSMGYKLAGFDVLGYNEIDPKMAECYDINLRPKYKFLEPIQDFKNRNDLPAELYDLTILDGSPPCSSFSTAGNREKDWGKKKKFREGQALQVLDTLFFDFLEITEKLRPKIVIAENVKGLIIGKAKKRAADILAGFEKAGYITNYFLLNGAKMGLPQMRERVFFIGIRSDLVRLLPKQNGVLFSDFPALNLLFNEKPIPFFDCSDENDKTENAPPSVLELLKKLKTGGKCGDVHPTGSFFSDIRNFKDRPSFTLTSKGSLYHYKYYRRLNKTELCKISSFPLDYDFGNLQPCYVMGMSVPPLMIAKIAREIYSQWITKIKTADNE